MEARDQKGNENGEENKRTAREIEFLGYLRLVQGRESIQFFSKVSRIYFAAFKYLKSPYTLL